MYQITGKQAEKAAKKYLLRVGYLILDTNWRRPNCEIDIIAQDPITNRVHFFEVKYRKDSNHGSPLEMITKSKLAQMVKAKDIWITENNYQDEYDLGAISVVGDKFRVEEVLESLSL